jgi:hypothetical protein
MIQESVRTLGSTQVKFVAVQLCSLLAVRALQAQAAPAEPAGRRHADAIFHPTLGEIVLAGGAPVRSAPAPTTFDDLWSWNGERWRHIATTGTAQMCGRLVFDAARQRLLLHGGTGMFPATAAPPAANGASLQRLPNGWWVENQGHLRQLIDEKWVVVDADTTKAFCTHVAFHDSQRDRLVLLGRAPGALPTTWQFDGRVWQDLQARPGALLSFQTSAFDTRRQRAVLVSGYTESGLSPNTYEFDGERWSVVSKGGPAPRLGAAAVFDEHAGRTIAYGGETPDGLVATDTWAWDGNSWSRLAADGPGPFDFPAMAYDRRRNVTVLFGMPPTGGPLQVWEFRTTWTRVR